MERGKTRNKTRPKLLSTRLNHNKNMNFVVINTTTGFTRQNHDSPRWSQIQAQAFELKWGNRGIGEGKVARVYVIVMLGEREADGCCRSAGSTTNSISVRVPLCFPPNPGLKSTRATWHCLLLAFWPPPWLTGGASSLGLVDVLVYSLVRHHRPIRLMRKPRIERHPLSHTPQPAHPCPRAGSTLFSR